MKIKIAFTGLPSCGKSTLAKNLYNFMESSYVPEMARSYIANVNNPPVSGDQYKIALMQSDLEKEIEKFDRITICDAPVYISAVYDHLYNNKQDVEKILDLNKQHKYDFIFNIVDIPKYEKDGVRYHTDEELFKLEKLIKIYNKKTNQNVVNVLSTNNEKRLDKILNYIT